MDFPYIPKKHHTNDDFPFLMLVFRWVSPSLSLSLLDPPENPTKPWPGAEGQTSTLGGVKTCWAPHRIHEWYGMFTDMNGCFFMVSKMEVNITYMDPMETNIGIVYDIYDIYIAKLYVDILCSIYCVITSWVYINQLPCVSILCCSQSLVGKSLDMSWASLMDLQNSHRELKDLNPLWPQIFV